MIEIQLINTATDKQIKVYPLKDFTIPYGTINENLQHQELTCTFEIEYDAEVFAFLVESEILRAAVYENSAEVFKGFINRDITFEDNGYPLPMDSISLSIEDNTSLLQEETEKEISFINKKLSYIIQKICFSCGIEIADNQIIRDITVEAFILEKESPYLEPFSNLLFQYGYSFIFNGRGELQLIDIMSSTQSPIPITEDDIYTGVQVFKTDKRYGGVRVTYNTLIKKENEQVYWEGNGLNDNNQVSPITILPNQYYPYASDPVVEKSEGQIFQNFENGYAESYQMYNGEQKYRRSNKTTLVYTENHVILKDWEGSLTVNRTEFGARQASVRFLNETKQNINLYQFAIRADAYYRSDDVVVNFGKSKNPYKYEAEYIYNASAADTFAEFLSRFFVGANFKITIQSAVAMPVGTHVDIDSGVSGFKCKAIIISCEYNCRDEKYKLIFLSYGDAAVLTSRFKKYSTNYGGFSLSQTIGKSISSITSQSYLSTSTLEPVNGYWSDEELSWESGKYLWVRTKIVYNSGDITFTGTMLVTNPDNNGIDSVVTEFAFSESRTEEPTDGWSTESPEWENGRYIWLRTVTKLSNNTVQTSKPACVTGAKGETGSSLKYLGLLNETPVSAHEGEFFLAESDWTTSESGTLLLTSGNALQLLNGTTLKTIGKSYQAGFIYYNDKGLWIQVTDKNDYRYISATNDLIKKGWKLSDNLQKVLDDADEKAQGYADSAETKAKTAAEGYASEAETNSKEYTDGQIAEKSEAFLEITDGLDEAIQSVTGKVNDIADDSKLTPDEKLTLLKEWANLSEEYSVLIAESKNVTVTYNVYQTAFKALATYLNGNNPWTSGIPLWLQSNRLSTVEEISGETMRSKFAQYNSEKTKLVNAISDKYAENAQINAENEAARLAENAEQNAIETAEELASSAETNSKKYADSLSENLSSVIQTLGSKYLGLRSALPLNANNGEFFLAESAFQDTGADRTLVLLNGTRLTLLNGSSILLKKAYQASYIYVLVDGLWTQLTDRNDYRYVSASNDLIKKGWKLSENLQVLLDGMDEDAKEYALNAENSSKKYTDDEVNKQSVAFKDITDNLENDVSSITRKIDDITSDSILSPSEKLGMLKDWITINDEYFVILEEAQKESLETEEFTDAYKNVAQSLNGESEWTSGTPLWLQAQWLTVSEDLSAFDGGTVIRQAFADYNSAKTSLIAEISEAYAIKAEINAKTYFENEIKYISEDGKITPFEKRTLLQKWQEIDAEFQQVIKNAEANKLDESYKKAYTECYNTLGTLLNGGTTWDSRETPLWLTSERLNSSEDIVNIDINKPFSDYTVALQIILNKINEKVGQNAEQNANNNTETQIEEAKKVIIEDYYEKTQADVEELKTQKISYVPKYLGPYAESPSTGVRIEDWYLNTTNKNLYECTAITGSNITWAIVSETNSSKAYKFSAAAKDCVAHAGTSGTGAKFGAAYIAVLFAHDIILTEASSVIKSEGFDDSIFQNNKATGMFRLLVDILGGGASSPSFSTLLVDQIVSGIIAAGSITLDDFYKGGDGKFISESLGSDGYKKLRMGEFSFDGIRFWETRNSNNNESNMGSAGSEFWSITTASFNNKYAPLLRSSPGLYVERNSSETVNMGLGLGGGRTAYLTTGLGIIAHQFVDESNNAGYIVFADHTVIRYGRIGDITSSGTKTVTFSPTFKDDYYSLFLINDKGSTVPSISSKTFDGFSIYGFSGNNYSYIAIGRGY